MKAIIHLSNGNHIQLDEQATQSLIQALADGKEIITFGDSTASLKYTISLHAIAIIEYTGGVA